MPVAVPSMMTGAASAGASSLGWERSAPRGRSDGERGLGR